MIAFRATVWIVCWSGEAGQLQTYVCNDHDEADAVSREGRKRGYKVDAWKM
jgi:hypothetical protein